MKKFLTILVTAMLAVCLIGCVSSTNVTFRSDVPNAEVYVDGQLVGKTPCSVKMSNAIWENPSVIVRAPGYQDNYYTVQRKVVGANVVIGCLLNVWAWLWCYGPAENQNVMMSSGASR